MSYYDDIIALDDPDSQTLDERVATFQQMIDDGTAWKMPGRIGREAMDLIESGYCVLGPVGHRDYYGNYVPSRDEVESGTKGSVEYANRLRAERGEDEIHLETGDGND